MGWLLLHRKHTIRLRSSSANSSCSRANQLSRKKVAIVTSRGGDEWGQWANLTLVPLLCNYKRTPSHHHSSTFQSSTTTSLKVSQVKSPQFTSLPSLPSLLRLPSLPRKPPPSSLKFRSSKPVISTICMSLYLMSQSKIFAPVVT